MGRTSDDSDEVFGDSLTQFEDKVLSGVGLQGQYRLDNFHAVNVLGTVDEFVLGTLHGLCLELLNLLFHLIVLVNVLLYGRGKVLGIIEEAFKSSHSVLQQVDGIFAVLTREGLNAADTCGNAALTDNLDRKSTRLNSSHANISYA